MPASLVQVGKAGGIPRAPRKSHATSFQGMCQASLPPTQYEGNSCNSESSELERWQEQILCSVPHVHDFKVGTIITTQGSEKLGDLPRARGWRRWDRSPGRLRSACALLPAHAGLRATKITPPHLTRLPENKIPRGPSPIGILYVWNSGLQPGESSSGIPP